MTTDPDLSYAERFRQSQLGYGPNPETEEAEPASQLPAGWQRLRTVQLEELLSEFAEPFLTDDDYDAVMEELGARDREAEQLAGHHHDQLDDPHNERPFP